MNVQELIAGGIGLVTALIAQRLGIPLFRGPSQPSTPLPIPTPTPTPPPISPNPNGDQLRELVRGLIRESLMELMSPPPKDELRDRLRRLVEETPKDAA